MTLVLLLSALLQEEPLQVLFERLGADDVAVRERAVKALSERGPLILPDVLSLYRATESAEVRLRAQEVLRQYPFLVYSRTDPREPLHEELRDRLLRGFQDHAGTKGCWNREDRKALPIDPARLRIIRQSASGHGQSLALDRIGSGPGGTLTVRRIAYQGKTPYRPSVKEDGALVQETTFDRGETQALVGLLEAAAGLQKTCAIPKDPQKNWTSSSSFSIHFFIESAGTELWSSAFTGYASSQTEKDYVHALCIDWALEGALAHRTWTAVPMLPEDRAWALEWITAHWPREGWWMKEFYLCLARFAGDGTYTPFLEKAASELEGKDGPSERRQRNSVREALSRIKAGKD